MGKQENQVFQVILIRWLEITFYEIIIILVIVNSSVIA